MNDDDDFFNFSKNYIGCLLLTGQVAYALFVLAEVAILLKEMWLE